MLKVRVITAVIGFIIAIFAITFGGLVYNSLITILALLGWREFVNMCKHRKIHPPLLWGFIWILISMTTMSFDLPLWSFASLVLAILVLGLIYIARPNRFNIGDMAYSAFGFIYILIGMSALMVLRHNNIYTYFSLPLISERMGEINLWLLLFTTWASDTFAYFVGRLCGKHKIVPTISPNKTLEGFIGGFIGCVLTGLIFAYIVGLPLVFGSIIGLLSGVFAPLGDLMESKLKRDCGVKDSGVLLPGHGGVLDRFDSLLYTAPMAVLYLLLLS